MEPLPDIGRNIPSGTIMEGMCRKSVTGEIKEVNKSRAPDAFNILTETIRPTRVGAMEAVDFIPSFAPCINASKTGTLRQNPNSTIKNKIVGTE